MHLKRNNTLGRDALERIDRLEQRVDNMESDLKPLSSLPAQIEMLIDIQRENNSNFKEFTKHIQDNYVSEKICNERCGNQRNDIKELKNFRIWIYISLLGVAGVIILELLKYIVK